MNGHLRLRFAANSTLLFVTFVWGATFSLTKAALNHVGVFAFLSVRFSVATITLTLLALVVPKVRQSFRQKAFRRKTLLRGTVLGLLLYGGYALQTLGLVTTTPAVAGFLTGLNVVIVPLLAFPVLRARPNLRNWIGAVVAVAGLVLLTGVGVNGWSLGDLLVLCCSFFIALQIVATERFLGGQNALAMTTVELAVLTLLCWITVWLGGGQVHGLSTWFEPSVFWPVIICALLGSAFAYAAQTFFQQSTSSTETAIIFTMEPVFAALIGWFSFHDTLGWSADVGCFLIFGSMMIADSSIRIPGFNRGSHAGRID